MEVRERNLLATLCVLVLTSGLSVHAVSQESLVNFRHLQHLTERIEFFGDSVDIVHVYANYPNYEWVDAKESGPEGIACVDDAGRAAVVYLRHYELTKDKQSLERAKALLKFVLKMQAADGEFYNFIYADHSINKNGTTSYKSFGWWAARGVWSTALGYRIFRAIDPRFAQQLKRAVEKAIPHAEKLLFKYGEVGAKHGFKIPKWLLFESASDATTELLFGLNEYYDATRSPKVKTLITRLAEGMMLMQDGDATKFPYGLHRSWETVWHMWGNGQTQALAQSGKLLNNKRMIASAEREAQGWYSRLLIHGFKKEIDCADTSKAMTYEQIAYGVRPMAVGLVRLYEATGKKEYLKMAGLACSWFFGNNSLQQQMYDTSTGVCFDGITDSTKVNKNSGAESTIEALHSVLEVGRFPEARKYLNYRKVRNGMKSNSLYAVFENSQGDELTLVLDLKKSKVVMLEGEKSEKYGVGK